jgi:hypothetical protein
MLVLTPAFDIRITEVDTRKISSTFQCPDGYCFWKSKLNGTKIISHGVSASTDNIISRNFETEYTVVW